MRQPTGKDRGGSPPGVPVGDGRGAPCPVCGQPRAGGERCANRWCTRHDRAFSAVYSVGAYQGRLRAAIIAYKFRDERWRADGFARLLSAYLRGHPTWFEEFGVIVGVPSYTGAGARRPWDPVGLILQRLAVLEGGGWLIAPEALAKTAETRPLGPLPGGERMRTAARGLRPALVVATPAVLDGARVLVVDDVMTEGSTLHEVSRAVLSAGAAEVAGLVVARPAWRRPRPVVRTGGPAVRRQGLS